VEEPEADVEDLMKEGIFCILSQAGQDIPFDFK
jgi:hypothetical protein